MPAKSIMIQGTMSNAGKSVLAAGLCSIFRQDGYKVAPFKSQNMALNSFITAQGLEMGRAQVMQAEAAGVEPTVEMNPILLKPTSDVGSQVIVNGRAVGNLTASEYFRQKSQLIPQVMEAYHTLEEQYDIVVLEGAGSPAEINLKSQDIVNMGLARMVGAPVLLAGDIDRGGVFAALYGTMALLEAEELCVCDIASLMDVTQSAVSHQLRVLKSSKLVKFRKEGKTVYYSLADDHVCRILSQGMEHICE